MMTRKEKNFEAKIKKLAKKISDLSDLLSETTATVQTDPQRLCHRNTRHGREQHRPNRHIHSVPYPIRFKVPGGRVIEVRPTVHDVLGAVRDRAIVEMGEELEGHGLIRE
jgi:hypothetical protein